MTVAPPPNKTSCKNLKHATNKRISRKGSVGWEVQRADEMFMCAGGGVTQREIISIHNQVEKVEGPSGWN